MITVYAVLEPVGGRSVFEWTEAAEHSLLVNQGYIEGEDGELYKAFSSLLPFLLRPVRDDVKR